MLPTGCATRQGLPDTIVLRYLYALSCIFSAYLRFITNVVQMLIPIDAILTSVFYDGNKGPVAMY